MSKEHVDGIIRVARSVIRSRCPHLSYFDEEQQKTNNVYIVRTHPDLFTFEDK
jgi:hypothetical protein